jgi:hypothetical protein
MHRLIPHFGRRIGRLADRRNDPRSAPGFAGSKMCDQRPMTGRLSGSLLKSVQASAEQGRTRRKKRRLYAVNEHFERRSDAVMCRLNVLSTRCQKRPGIPVSYAGLTARCQRDPVPSGLVEF